MTTPQPQDFNAAQFVVDELGQHVAQAAVEKAALRAEVARLNQEKQAWDQERAQLSSRIAELESQPAAAPDNVPPPPVPAQ